MPFANYCNVLLRLLLVLELLSGCRSERVAFDFQPLRPAYQTTSANAPDSISSRCPAASATNSAHTAASQKIAAISTAKPSAIPATAQLKKPLFRSSNPSKAMAAKFLLNQHRKSQASRSATRPAYSGPSDETVIIFLVCAVGGILSLLVALFTSSGTLAIIGLVLLIIAILLFIISV